MMRLCFNCILFAAWVLTASQTSADYVFIVAPNGLENTEGATNSGMPFISILPVRYQQVYQASQFGKLPPGGGSLLLVSLRTDCFNHGGIGVTNFEVRLSTTQRNVDELSDVFSENIGDDELLMFSSRQKGSVFVAIGGGGDCRIPRAEQWYQTYFVNLQNPFWYDPAKGNLLLEMRVSERDLRFFPLMALMDAQSIVGDGVSRVAGEGHFGSDPALITTGSIVDTMGIVTLFSFYVPPGLEIQGNGDSLTLVWGKEPITYHVQSSDQIESSSNWVTYLGPVEVLNDGTSKVVLPLDPRGPPKYFRLFSSESPPHPPLADPSPAAPSALPPPN